MPVQFTRPPNTRAVGTGDPPGDMDNVVSELAGIDRFNILSGEWGTADPGTPSTPGADSSAAFQACMNACTGTGTVPAGEMIIPPGNYTASGLHINGPLKIRGLGASNGYNSVVTGAVSTLPGVKINCAASTYLFNMPAQGYLWGGLEMSGININFTGTGNVFDSVNFADSAFRDMTVTLTAGGSQVMTCSGANSVLNVIHERCTFVTTNAVRTKPMFSIASTIGAGISNNTFFKCKFSNAGQDNTQFMVEFSCTGTGSAYHVADNFVECWFEHPFGGVYKSLSGSNIKLDGCIAWDIQGGSPLIGNSLYYFGAAAGNAGSQATTIRDCGRNLNGPDGTATNKWDAEFESTSSGVQIQNYITTTLNPTTTYNVYFNFHGCNDVVLINPQAPQGASVNGNSTTVITNPSPTQVVIGQGAVSSVQQGTFSPADASFRAWNFDPASIGASVGATSGTVQAIRLDIRSPVTFSNIVMFQSAAGTGLVAGNFVGLYTSAGAQVAVSAEQSGNWNSGTNVFKPTAMTGAPFTIQPGIYFVLALSNQSAGTTPTWGRWQSFTAQPANAGLSVALSRWATGSAAQTALPASFTPSTYLTQTQTEYFVALS